MSGEPRGTPPDPAGAGGPSPAGGDPLPPAGRRPDRRPATGPPDWDPLSGWDDEPASGGAGDGWPADATGAWAEPPTGGDPGAWSGWPPGGDNEAWDTVQPRKGWARTDGGESRAGRLRAGSWRDHPAARFGMLGLAAMLLLAAVATARPGAPGERDAGPAVAARAAGPAPARTAYAFARPAGWRDATRAHAARFPGARPDVVLVGPASAGANLSVVRSVAGPDRPALEGIPGAALRRLHAADARQVGRSRWLTVAGEPAVAADYLLARGRFRARQVACYHQGDLYLVTLTAEEGAFASQARVQDRVLRSWRWT